MKYKLISNDIELKTNYIEYVLRILEVKFCCDCKITYEQATINAYSNAHDDDVYIQVMENIEKNKDCFFPSNYDFMWDKEKVDALLNTQCGANYTFESKDD